VLSLPGDHTDELAVSRNFSARGGLIIAEMFTSPSAKVGATFV
jgi:hypothetical protein